MVYEFCLEYGAYPVKPIEGFAYERNHIPDFLQDNPELLARLETLNQLFHDLFVTIECRFDYVGKQYPEKIAALRPLYESLAQDLIATYGESQSIRIEPFIL